MEHKSPCVNEDSSFLVKELQMRKLFDLHRNDIHSSILMPCCCGLEYAVYPLQNCKRPPTMNKWGVLHMITESADEAPLKNILLLPLLSGTL